MFCIKLYLAKVRWIFVITKKIGIFLKSISLILHKATGGCVISLDNGWCITVDYRMHNRCCACAYQLLCKRTTAVVRPKILTVSTTYPISSNNLFYLFQQHILSLSATYPISFSDISYLFQRHILSLSTNRRGWIINLWHILHNLVYSRTWRVDIT